jgi:3-oxoacyl-[acyl-carrier-protein] synthase-3
MDAAVKRIKVPVEKFYVNIDRFANTSSASIPIALDEMVKKGLIKRGDRMIFAAFGAGLVYGGVAVEWTK